MKHLVGSTFLIAGTTIGAAMLALPIDTGLMGFFPGMALFVVIWLALLLTAFYFMEVALHAPKGSNMITMAAQTLGPIGKGLCAFVYVLLLYALVGSYLSGGASALHGALVDALGWQTPFSFALICFCAIFGLFIYLGTASVDRLNRILFAGLIISFVGLIFLVYSHVDFSRLYVARPRYIWSGIAIVVTSFGFHIVIPTLRDYLGRSEKLMRQALWIGGAIPLIFYLTWNAIVLGVLSTSSIAHAVQTGAMPQVVLERQMSSPEIGALMGFFAFFAITTSFLGVSMSLLDFIADGLKIKKSRIGRMALCLIVFIPPIIFVLSDPSSFYKALRFGGIMVTILLGIFPPLMAAAQRKSSQEGGYRVWGGSPLIHMTLLFFFAVLAICLIESFS